ncbi:hypothetical protein [Pseudomonas paralcaligenes]|uniref:hypothetical protein n=1 Tax=Pseudomonas paralcaligenes TaxID=2772558 RepID=UPI001C8277EA|nr:hypothetical protein [Pseudomonas paralcaligenes]
MKKHVISYLIGFASAALIALTTSQINKAPPRSYNFEDKRDREKMVSILESKGMLYSYNIDHLKRHWIIPWIDDVELLESVEQELEDWRASRNAG